MKQKILLLVISCITTFPSFSQFYVKGGIDFSSATTGSVKTETGFHLGGGYDTPLSRRLFFHLNLIL